MTVPGDQINRLISRRTTRTGMIPFSLGALKPLGSGDVGGSMPMTQENWESRDAGWNLHRTHATEMIGWESNASKPLYLEGLTGFNPVDRSTSFYRLVRPSFPLQPSSMSDHPSS